jgi:hypothetical protein
MMDFLRDGAGDSTPSSSIMYDNRGLVIHEGEVGTASDLPYTLKAKRLIDSVRSFPLRANSWE